MEVAINGLQVKKSRGAISWSIPNKHIFSARQQAFFLHANYIALADLNLLWVREFERLFQDAQHPNGLTWTENHRNLKMSHNKTTSRAAEQRLGNTGLSDKAAVQASALQPYSSSAGEVSGGQNGHLFEYDCNVREGIECD
jgi:hypothetical protein